MLARNTRDKFGGAHGQMGSQLILWTTGKMVEARMRKALLALILAGAALVALATASSPAPAAPALVALKAVDAASAVTKVDYRGRYYNRGYRPYYRRPVDYAYRAAPRPYYGAPAYYAPPVVYYQPPPVLYYPPPVAYAPVAPYRYGYGVPSAAYYDGYSDW
jgi:hypothetical protein